MSEQAKIKAAMGTLKARGYVTRMSLSPANAQKFYELLQGKPRGAYLIGHDLEGTYDKDGALQRRLYLGWMGEPEEIIGAFYEQGLNIYWNGSMSYAMEIRPAFEERAEMDF